MTLAPLPIDAVRDELLAALRDRGAAVLRAPTGAGKTTRVPSAILDSGVFDGTLVMLEPRRLAARAAARRIAYERDVKLGREVGYRVRFDDRSSQATRILVVTEGVLVRMLQEDPFLEGFGCVVFDEFHERNLQGDLALAMTRRARDDARSDLGIVVMSATLEPTRVAHWLGDCPVVESEGRLHPVSIEYLDPVETRDRPHVSELVERHARAALGKSDGHVLAFLPGVGEIRRAREALDARPLRGTRVLELYGELSPEDQDRVLDPAGPRKLILATNVAETSVTIEGVDQVIDSGLVKRLHHEADVGLDRLRTERVSRASADQRAGRAGRTRPGRCLRLWTEAEDRALDAEERPEIARVDLSGCVLELAAWGETDVAAFPWFEDPPRAALERAYSLLRLLGALDDRGAVTELGRRLVRMPVAPRLARLLLEGEARGVAFEAALTAAFLSERDPFRRGPRTDHAARWSDSDVVDRVHALEAFEERGETRSFAGTLDPGAARFALRVRDQLERSIEARATEGDRDVELRRALFRAFPDRLCRRRESDLERGVMVGGRGVRLARECAVREGELFCAVELQGGSGDALVRLASRVEREWLDERQLATGTHVEFDEAREKLAAVRRTTFADLTLDESPTELPDGEETWAALARAAEARLDRALDLGALEPFRARVRFLREHCPELELPACDEAELLALLPDLARGRRSFAELRRAPVLDHLRATLRQDQLQALEREAPVTIEVPTGSKIRLAYEPGRPPVLAVRIQELFGLKETPRVARGRVPVLLHLLAPNMRPQQVTDDLASFWNGAYQDVRKELRRRYPKHSWPEDPWTASAVRGARRRRPS